MSNDCIEKLAHCFHFIYIVNLEKIQN